MIKTPQEYRRENVKKLFDRILPIQKIKLEPLVINVSETWQSDFTMVKLSYSISKGDDFNTVDAKEQEAKGFVDGIFKACFENLVGLAPSLSNVKLYDYQVKPKLKTNRSSSGADAKVSVNIIMEVKEHGLAEFSNASRSVLHSSFAAILEAFQFYVNCEKTFHKIQLVLEDAKQRNRGDIIQSCVSDLSKLTEVNTYEKK